MAEKIKVIGLVIEEIYTDFAREVIEDAKRAVAADKNTRLVVIPGKYDDGIKKDLYTAVYNTVFSLGSLCGIDGLVIHIARPDSMKPGDAGGLPDVPTVYISSGLEGHTTIGYDNRTGIREAIDGLVNLNGITEICMLGGREDNYEARLRKKIFIECLKSHGIMFRGRMFEPTNMSTDTEIPAGRLIDRNPDVRAIFCVNDGSAVGLYKAMKKRGLVPGKDILVFGFDNTRMSSGMKPSLTSIGADTVTIGQRAVELVLAKIDGHEVHSELVRTRLFGRRSFSYVMYEYNVKDLIGVNKLFIYRIFDDCFYRYGRSPNDREDVDLKRLFYEIFSRMLRAMNSRYISIEEYNEVGRLIDIFFDEGAMRYTDSDKLLESINRLQEGMAAVQRMNGVTVNVSLNRLFLHMKDKVIMVLAEKSIRDSGLAREADGDLCAFMRETQFAGGNIRHICSGLRLLGVSNAAVFMFPQPVVYEDGKPVLFPEKIDLICTIKDRELYVLPEERAAGNMKDMLRRRELPPKCSSYAAFPVFFRDTVYGFIMCEPTDDIYTRGEYIAALLGKTIYLDGTV